MLFSSDYLLLVQAVYSKLLLPLTVFVIDVSVTYVEGHLPSV